MRHYWCLLPLFLGLCALLFAEQTLTLQECLELARKESASLHVATLRTEQAVQVKNQVRSSLLPHLSAEGVWDNRNDALSGSLTQFQEFKSTTALGLTLRQSLFDFGVSLNRLKASQVRIGASRCIEQHASLQEDEKVRTAYFKIFEAQSRINAFESSIRTLSAQLKTSEDLLERGLIKRADALAIRVQLATIRGDVLKAHNGATLAKMELCRLIGYPLDTPLSLAPVKVGSDQKACTETALAFALEHRPDLLSLKKQLRAQNFDKTATNLSHLPNIYAFGNGNFSKNKSMVSAGIGMSLPLYEGGRKSAESGALAAECRALCTQVRDKERQIELEVLSNSMQLAEAQESLRIAKEALAYSEESLFNAQDLYREGQVSVYDLLLAESALSNAQLGVASAHYHVNSTRAHLITITGGWNVDD